MIACSSCGSTLAYQFESLRRQTFLGDFQTLCLSATIVKMFNKPILLLVDVSDNGILPYADEGSEVVPVDDCPGALLPKLRCSLNTHREVESCAEETMVRSRVKLWNNSGVGQAKPSIGDDVETFRFDPATRKWENYVAPMLHKRYAFDVATLDDFIYVVGGSNGAQCLNAVERYDPRRNQWTSEVSMGTCRAGVSVSVLNGCLYAVGGCSLSTLNTVESYTTTLFHYPVAPYRGNQLDLSLACNQWKHETTKLGCEQALHGCDGERLPECTETDI
ncbi:kelch repeat protein [Teladorsagia circumcincta]|uniref:Kelch repeat protein n=1 Tax=Teladorsagia circumcincta TaxID=45464 RepID=A0A2G9V3B7_TELCI|nr:kelch repeat protein [Teladorsagia circumcincta]